MLEKEVRAGKFAGTYAAFDAGEELFEVGVRSWIILMFIEKFLKILKVASIEEKNDKKCLLTYLVNKSYHNGQKFTLITCVNYYNI